MSDKSVLKETLLHRLQKPGFLLGLVGMLLLQIGALLIISESNPLFLPFVEYYSYPTGGLRREIIWHRVIGSIFILIGFIFFSYYFFKQVSRTAASPEERASDETAYEIKNLRREFSRFKSDDFNVTKLEDQLNVLIDGQKRVSLTLQNMNELTWSKVLLTGRERLIEETQRLGARSRLNLSWGVVISSLAVAYLTYFVFFSETIDSSKPYAFASYYGPRLSLILIVQILASFFLKMYVSNEKSIQKNKNEITNLELRLAAGLLVNSSTQKSKLAEKLITEERNFVLDKKEKPARVDSCLLYTSPSPRDKRQSRMPSSA